MDELPEIETVAPPDIAEEDMLINERGEAWCGGKLIAKSLEWDILMEEIRKWCMSNSYYPAIWSVNDHGNISLLNKNGDEIKSWV